MRLALMIEGQEGVSWKDWLALAEACEEHGVEALFRSDHYLSQTDADRAALDAWAVIPALAARTDRIGLGTLVSPVTFRQPAVLANASITAYEISGGRVSLGMGTGWMEAEHEAFGFPFPPMTTACGCSPSRSRQYGATGRPSAPAPDRRRQRPLRHDRTGCEVGRRVQHRHGDAGGVRRATHKLARACEREAASRSRSR